MIPVAMAASSQGYRIYDSLGTAWNLMILASGTQVPKYYVRIANDTATYSFGPSWILSGDTAYALTQMNDTLVTSVGTITATQTFSAGIAIPTAAPSAGQSPLRWLAQAGRGAASLAEFLALPDAAEAQVVVPSAAFIVPVAVCPTQSADVFFAGLGLVGSIFAVFITSATPAIVPSTLAGMYTGYTFGRRLGDLDRCLGGGGGGGSDSTGGHRARPT